jgi:hypothetical protein
VVWEGTQPASEDAVWLLDLKTGEIRKITEVPGGMSRPQVSDQRVFWTVKAACDVRPITKEGTGAFAHDLDTGIMLQLSGYVEPRVEIDSGIAVIAEGCFIPQRVFAVFLDG